MPRPSEVFAEEESENTKLRPSEKFTPQSTRPSQKFKSQSVKPSEAFDADPSGESEISFVDDTIQGIKDIPGAIWNSLAHTANGVRYWAQDKAAQAIDYVNGVEQEPEAPREQSIGPLQQSTKLYGDTAEQIADMYSKGQLSDRNLWDYEEALIKKEAAYSSRSKEEMLIKGISYINPIAFASGVAADYYDTLRDKGARQAATTAGIDVTSYAAWKVAWKLGGKAWDKATIKGERRLNLNPEAVRKLPPDELATLKKQFPSAETEGVNLTELQFRDWYAKTKIKVKGQTPGTVKYTGKKPIGKTTTYVDPATGKTVQKVTEFPNKRIVATGEGLNQPKGKGSFIDAGPVSGAEVAKVIEKPSFVDINMKYPNQKQLSLMVGTDVAGVTSEQIKATMHPYQVSNIDVHAFNQVIPSRFVFRKFEGEMLPVKTIPIDEGVRYNFDELEKSGYIVEKSPDGTKMVIQRPMSPESEIRFPMQEALDKRLTFDKKWETTLLDIQKPIMFNKDSLKKVTYFLEGKPYYRAKDGGDKLSFSKNPMTEKELTAANRLREEFYNPLFKEFGLDAEKFLKEYQPHIRANRGVDFTRGTGPTELSFFADKERTGELFQRETNSLDLALYYLKAGSKNMFLGEVSREVLHVASQYPPELKEYVKEYVAGIQGRGNKINKKLAKDINGQFEKMKSSKRFSEEQLEQAARVLTNIAYLSTLGFRVSSAVRNHFQKLLVVAELGPMWTLGGWAWMHSPKAKGLIEKYNVHTLPSEAREALRGQKQGKLDKTVDLGMSLFTAVDQSNRDTAFSGYMKFSHYLNKLSAGQLTRKQFDQRISWNGIPRAWQRKIQAAIKKGDSEAASAYYGKFIVEDTQWLYGRGESPQIGRSIPGKLGVQFLSWFSNYLNKFGQWGVNKQWGKISRFVAASVLTGYGAKKGGVNLWDWLLFGPFTTDVVSYWPDRIANTSKLIVSALKDITDIMDDDISSPEKFADTKAAGVQMLRDIVSSTPANSSRKDVTIALTEAEDALQMTLGILFGPRNVSSFQEDSGTGFKGSSGSGFKMTNKKSIWKKIGFDLTPEQKRGF